MALKKRGGYLFAAYDCFCGGGKCPCDIEDDSLSGPQLTVTGLLFANNTVEGWSIIPFTQGNNVCGQTTVPAGEYDSSQTGGLLVNARDCSFDGIAVKDGAVACFYDDVEGKILSAVMIGPVIVNNLLYKDQSVRQGVIPAVGYKTYWDNLYFADNARYITVCKHDGSFPDGLVVYKP